MKKTLVIGLAALITGGVTRAGDFSLSSDLTFASDYIFRGINLADNTLHPSLEFAQDALYAGIWAALPMENRESRGLGDEIDFYAGWTPQLSDALSLDLGATYYYYPTGDSTTEAFLGANFTAGNLTPGVYVYYDFDLETFTTQGNLGFSLPMDSLGTSLDLAGSVGYVSPDVGESYTYYSVGASVPYKLNENSTVKLGVNWSTHTLDGVEDNHLWYTLGVTIGF